jgi:hypothetical protein
VGGGRDYEQDHREDDAGGRLSGRHEDSTVRGES